MQNAAFAAAGIDAVYEAMRVPRDGISEAIDRLRAGFAGFNVTTPLKEAVLAQVDALVDIAQDVMAVNTVRIEHGRLTGHNTDGAGFVNAVAELWNYTPRGRNACILGSGPAARAIGRELAKRGAPSVTCWSRNPLTAEQIGPPPEGRPELLVSALPADAVVPAEILDIVSGATYLFDVNYRAERSAVPATIGRHRSDGLPLLLHQGALSFQWWTGIPAPLDVMRAAIKQHM